MGFHFLDLHGYEVPSNVFIRCYRLPFLTSHYYIITEAGYLGYYNEKRAKVIE